VYRKKIFKNIIFPLSLLIFLFVFIPLHAADKKPSWISIGTPENTLIKNLVFLDKIFLQLQRKEFLN